MNVQVKICGLRTANAMEAALEGGADYVGLVFFPQSPRNVAPDAAAALAATARARARVVALLVDPDDTLLEAVVASVDPDMLQLHGRETPERAQAIRRRWGKPVMKAIPVGSVEDARAAARYAGFADLILFDARAPELATRPGGNGATFDWRMLMGIEHPLPYMLSGGLTPENVGAALRTTGATMVDVSSGVESRPGEKDPALIRRFLLAAKGAP